MNIFKFYLVIALLFTSAYSVSAQCECHWISIEEYGTFYPSLFDKVEIPENGKGFFATDGIGKIWSDCRLILEDDPVYPREELVTVTDTVYVDSAMRYHLKVVAFHNQYYSVEYSFPEDKSEIYMRYEKDCINKFPKIKKHI